MAPRVSYWTDLKTTSFAEADAERRIALLPVGAVEQHGPHLPLGTDSFILDAVIARCADRLIAADDLPADRGPQIVILPTQSIGDSLEHRDFTGTLSQTPESLIESWTRIGHAVADAGIRKLALVNSHGGQPQIVDIVAQRLRAQRGMLAARLNTFRLGVPEGLFPEDELAHGYHGGSVETSMMLAIAPHLVDMDEALSFDTLAARLAAENRVLGAEGRAGFAWQAQDLNAEGAMGDAASADAERGERVLDHLAARLDEALREVAAFPLALLSERPG